MPKQTVKPAFYNRLTNRGERDGGSFDAKIAANGNSISKVFAEKNVPYLLTNSKPYCKIRVRIIIVILFCALLSSCASNIAYYANLDGLAANQRFSDAAKLTQTSKDKYYGDKNALLYCLDIGFFLHTAGDYEESNKYFEKAKELFDYFFTKSITTEASTWLISDNTRPYYGEDFERVLVNIFSAINYTMLGKMQDALVEARQADQFLTSLQTKYGYKNVYKEDAFARYFLGMLYENNGERNDAYISYFKALKAYEKNGKYYNFAIPAELIISCKRLAYKLGFADDLKDINEKYQNIPRASSETPLASGQSSNMGELVVINYNGLAPKKVETIFEISFGNAWLYVNANEINSQDEEQVEKAGSIARSIFAQEQVRMAFPKYENSNYTIETMELGLESSALEPKKAVLADDIGEIAKVSLDDKITRIRAKTIARAAIKFALAHEISAKVAENNGETGGFLSKIAMAVASTLTEKADRRSWRVLPDKILISTIALPEGKNSVILTFRDKYGNKVYQKTINDIQIMHNKKTFYIVRTAQ